MEDGIQRENDKHFIQNLLTNNTQVVEEGQDGRKVEVIAILNRVLARGGRRGGPTKNMLIQLSQLCPGQPELIPTLSKADMVDIILRTFPDDHQPPQPPPVQPPAVPPVVDLPVGPPPVGWGHWVDDRDFGGPLPPRAKSLLRLKRGQLSSLSKEKQLELLLKEQDELQQVKRNPGPDILAYIRSNLVEMGDDSAPIPPDLDDAWAIYLYEKILQKEIQKFQSLFLHTTTNSSGTGRGERDNPVVLSTSESSSDDDLSSYYPNKKYAVKKKKKRKRRSRKSRKRRKKKKKKRSRSSSSASRSSGSSSSSSEEESNSKRVSSASYGPNHYEQLQEFRDGYRAYYDDGHAGDWPEDDALKFIAKKFARAGCKLAHKVEGVRKKFVSGLERDHARKRTVQIYDMSDTIAELRLERNEQMARELRRMDGAGKAKRARMKSKLRKFHSASIEEEQTLVSRVGVYCDLVLMGKASWDNFHSELGLGGQKEAIVEGTGGLVSKGVAAKAWKKAQASTLKPIGKKKKRKPEIKTRDSTPGGSPATMICFWCNKPGHRGKDCADKKAGKPPHPASRQAKFDKKNEANKFKQKGIVVTKPP